MNAWTITGGARPGHGGCPPARTAHGNKSRLSKGLPSTKLLIPKGLQARLALRMLSTAAVDVITCDKESGELPHTGCLVSVV
jgi:hypothetical protein